MPPIRDRSKVRSGIGFVVVDRSHLIFEFQPTIVLRHMSTGAWGTLGKRVPRSAPMRVLVIDDEEDGPGSVRHALHETGAEAIIENDPDHAFLAIENSDCPVFLISVSLAAMVGIKLIRFARRHHPDAWIIATSDGRGAMPASVALNLARMVGADRILYKPLTGRDIEAAMPPDVTTETGAAGKD
jgi:CheY-like chemotaxis protein